jgi:hypothetical protein
VLHLPLPVASDAPPGVPVMEQQFSLFDESDWPGGIVQRFRALRPLVDATLEGCGCAGAAGSAVVAMPDWSRSCARRLHMRVCC